MFFDRKSATFCHNILSKCLLNRDFCVQQVKPPNSANQSDARLRTCHSHVHPPITALGSVPKAHTQGEPDGTWNLEKLHLELKYLGRKLADAKLRRQTTNAALDPRQNLTSAGRRKHTWTACSFWGLLRRRCARCRGRWTRRWATRPDWSWCWSRERKRRSRGGI